MAVNSFVFDEQFYLTQNPDVAAAVSAGGFASGQAHFNAFGRFEGRDPNAYFDTSFYLGTYPDVAAANVNPFTHFQANGASEGRLFNANIEGTVDTDGDDVADEFDSAAYLAANTDVAAAIPGQFASAYQHYVLFGQFEGRPGAQLTDGTALNGPFQTGSTGGGNVGQTFTLTASADGPGAVAPAINTQGTDANDTYNGVNGSIDTFTIADTIDGGAGTDSLNLVLDAGGATTGLAGVKNVENFFIRDLGASTSSDFGVVAGEKQVWNDRSTSTATFTNLGTGTIVGVKGDGNTVVGDTVFDMATATDAVNLAIDGGTKGTGGISTAAGTATAATIASTGAANTVGTVALSSGSTVAATTINATTDLTTGGISGHSADAKITVTGAGKVGLGTLEANVKTVDASANSGGTTVVLGQAADIFTGGSGNDTVTLAAGATGPTGAVDGGAGTGDRVIITNDSQIDTAAEQGKVTNFEIARLAEAGDFAFDATKLAGITAIESASSGNTTITALSSAQAISVVADGTSLSLANPAFLAAGADTQTVTFDNSVNKLVDGVDLGSLTVTNADTLNVVSSGLNLTGTNTSSIGSLATGNGDLETVNISGDTAFSLTTGAASVDNVNASTFTGNLTVTATTNTAAISITGGSGKNDLTGSGNGDVIKGGAAVDAITGGFGADTLSGNGGNDIFVFQNLTAGAGTGSISASAPAGVDNEEIAYAAATVDDADETYSIVYTLNGVSGVLGGNFDAVSGGIDTTDVAAVETFLAAQLDGVTGISAAVSGGDVVASADNQGSLTINSVTFGGTTPGSATVSDGTDVTANSTVTIDADPVVGETYSITVTPVNGTATTASFTATTTNPQDVVNGLIAALNPGLAGAAVAGDVSGPNTNQFTITDLNADNGGFTVSGTGVSVTTYAGDTNVSISGTTVSGFDKITDYTADVIRFTAGDNVADAAVTAPVAATSVQIDGNGKVSFAGADDTLAEKVAALAADDTNVASNEVVFFEDGGNTYVYGAGVDTTDVSTDFLVELTGVVGLTKITESTTTGGDFTIA
jgi:hypothetical protein